MHMVPMVLLVYILLLCYFMILHRAFWSLNCYCVNLLLSGGCWHGYLSGRAADLHMAQLMPLPLTVSCFSRIKIGFVCVRVCVHACVRACVRACCLIKGTCIGEPTLKAATPLPSEVQCYVKKG